MGDETDNSSDLDPRLVGLIIAVVLVPLLAVFHYFNKENIGLVVLSISAVFIGTIYVYRGGYTFRILAEIFILYVIHIIVVLNLHLPAKIPGFIMIPIAIADGVFVLLILYFLEKIGKKTAE